MTLLRGKSLGLDPEKSNFSAAEVRSGRTIFDCTIPPWAERNADAGVSLRPYDDARGKAFDDPPWKTSDPPHSIQFANQARIPSRDEAGRARDDEEVGY